MRLLVSAGLIFSLLYVFSIGNIVYAQIFESLVSVQISISPKYPQPGQLVTATVSSSSEDLQAAHIIWLLDKEIQQQEVGVDTFLFTAPSVGVVQDLSVLVKIPNGQTLSSSVTIQPAQVTLVWEGDTYTPPFYKGRSLYSSDSLVRAQALPRFANENGDIYKNSALIYTWSRNGTVLGTLSGVGKDSLVTTGPKFLGSYILSVEVATPDGTQIAYSATRIETSEPLIQIYEHDPLVGTKYYDAILENHTFSGASQLEVQVAPYFMDILRANDSYVDYAWFINNTTVSPSRDDKSLLTIQLSRDENISTNIRVIADHSLHLLQTGTGIFNILFEGSARNTLFGL